MKRALLAACAAISLLFSIPGFLDAAPNPGREELLGQLEVDFRADRDVIEVGRHEGRFEKLRVVVRGAPIQLRAMKVTFEDDSVLDMPGRGRVLRENSAFVFDLPGQRRVIKSITFEYRSIDRREGKATVLVYGQHSTREGRRGPGGPGGSGRVQLLGQQEVDFRADRDVIEVGKDEGQFQRIRIVVRGAPIELRDVKVTFGDDSVHDPVIGSRILRENSAYEFDFPRGVRFIKQIAFEYRSLNRREGKATVLVYGLH